MRVFLAGHNGMVGSSVLNLLKESSGFEVLIANRAELDLTNQDEVKRYFLKMQPDYVVIAAARVGGINANNTYPADFIYENLMIECNLIHQAFLSGVKRLLFLGSSCLYPKFCDQPMKEEMLLSGRLEETNEPYAIAKIAGIKLCESYNRQFNTDFRSLMPTNLYGENDNFNLEDSHVIPALLKQFHNAKLNDKDSVSVWGDGKPLREFLHVNDLANACLFILNLAKDKYDAVTDQQLSHLNVGSGEEISIKNLSEIIAKIVNFKGDINFDISKPTGTPRKLLDSSKIKGLGWSPEISLKDGLENTYDWFKNNHKDD